MTGKPEKFSGREASAVTKEDKPPQRQTCYQGGPKMPTATTETDVPVVMLKPLVD
jgi:hypothetical protein